MKTVKDELVFSRLGSRGICISSSMLYVFNTFYNKYMWLS